MASVATAAVREQHDKQVLRALRDEALGLPSRQATGRGERDLCVVEDDGYSLLLQDELLLINLSRNYDQPESQRICVWME